MSPNGNIKMARTTPPDDEKGGDTDTALRRKRPPAIHIGTGGKPIVGGADAGRGKVHSYASPARGILNTIGAPRAIQRVFASARGSIDPARAHAPADDDRQIRSVTDIGNRVRDARNAMGMTQQRFADLAGVGRRFLIELEHGKPGLEIGRVLAVCKAAGIRLGFLP